MTVWERENFTSEKVKVVEGGTYFSLFAEAAGMTSVSSSFAFVDRHPGYHNMYYLLCGDNNGGVSLDTQLRRYKDICCGSPFKWASVL